MDLTACTVTSGMRPACTPGSAGRICVLTGMDEFKVDKWARIGAEWRPGLLIAGGVAEASGLATG